MKRILPALLVILFLSILLTVPAFAVDTEYVPEIPPFLVQSGAVWDLTEKAKTDLAGIPMEARRFLNEWDSGPHLLLVEQWSDNGYYHGEDYGEDRKWTLDYVKLKDKSSNSYGIGSFVYRGGDTGSGFWIAPMRFIPSEEYEVLQLTYQFGKDRLITSGQIETSVYPITFSYVVGGSPLSNACTYYPGCNTLDGKAVFTTASDVPGIDRHYNWWLGIDVEIPPHNPDVDIKPDGSIDVPAPDDDGKINVSPGTGGDKPTVDKDGTAHIPDGGKVTYPDGTEVRPPNGSVLKPDGTIHTPNDTVIHPNGNVDVPDGNGGHTTVTPGTNGSRPHVNGDTVTVPDGGKVVFPDGSQVKPPNGSTVKPDGSVHTPGGTVIHPNGNIDLPGGGGTTVVKPGTGGGRPSYDNGNGTVHVPGGGTVILPGGDHTVIVGPGGGTVKPGGTVVIPSPGDVIVDGNKTEMPNGGTVKPDGTITVNPPGGGGSGSGGSGSGGGGSGDNWNPPDEDGTPDFGDFPIFNPHDYDDTYEPIIPDDFWDYDPMDGFEDNSWLAPPDFPVQPIVPEEYPRYDLGVDNDPNPFTNIPWW